MSHEFSRYTTSDLIRSPDILPDCAGAYLITLDDSSPWADMTEIVEDLADPFTHWPLLYVGATEHSLRSRLKRHFGDDSRVSSFRQTAGLLLSAKLGLEACGSREARCLWFRDEAPLTAWLVDNTWVAFAEDPEPFLLERQILATQPGLLNLTSCPWGPLKSHLRALRRMATRNEGPFGPFPNQDC